MFLPVSEDRLGRGLEHATGSMSRELMLTSEQQRTSPRHSRRSDNRRSTDALSTARLQSDTDSHVLKLLDLFC